MVPNNKIIITYFVHGTTTDNEQGRSSGWKNVGLSELGVRQSLELKDQTKEKRFDVVFCSDLKRAVDSANITWKGVFPIVIDGRLRECNYGDLNGAQTNTVDELGDSIITQRFPHGENYLDVEKRIRSFLDNLKQKYAGKHIAIVAHKAPQLALDVILKGKTWKQTMKEDWRHTHAWKPGWEYVLHFNQG